MMIGLIKGDTRSSDYGSNVAAHAEVSLQMPNAGLFI